MALQPKVRQYSGNIRMWRIAVNGALSAVIPVSDDPQGNQPIEANATAFTYEEGDSVQIVSKQNGARYNQPIYDEQLPGTNGLNLQLLEMPAAILARVLRADMAESSVTAGAVVDAPHAVADLVKPVQLAHRYLLASPTPVIKLGADTLEAGTDYLLERRTGKVTPVAGGALAAAIEADSDGSVTILASYSYPALHSTEFLGGAKPREKFYITGDMQDRISGEYGDLEIFEANLGPDGDIDWLATEPLQPNLTGPLLAPAGAPAPYKFTTYSPTI
jgi:hypothetical protein